jgi:hypothetical protein
MASEEKTFTGRVKIFSIDQNDKVTAVYLESQDEKYLVNLSHQGRDLLSLVGRDLRVVGTPGSNQENMKTLTVSSYEIIDKTREDELLWQK